jgi:hypothetical protein
MTKDTLLKKLQELEDQEKGLVADINAVAGAIQFCKQLLAEFDQPQ